jgi:purine-binding chemotaxis protein CheW
MADFAARLLLVRVDDMVCAAEADVVREILPLQRATRIPGAPTAVTGLINVRGELVPLIDGARLLRRPAPEATGAVVLMRWGDTAVALTVDEVLDLVPVPATDLAGRETLVGIDPAVVRAVGRHGDRTFVILDLDALLGPLLTA